MTKYRKTNRLKLMSRGCGNHSSCKICEGNRLYSSTWREEAADPNDVPIPTTGDVCTCGLPADWAYTGGAPYYCDVCVPRGNCSCLEEDEQGEPCVDFLYIGLA